MCRGRDVVRALDSGTMGAAIAPTIIAVCGTLGGVVVTTASALLLEIGRRKREDRDAARAEKELRRGERKLAYVEVLGQAARGLKAAIDRRAETITQDAFEVICIELSTVLRALSVIAPASISDEALLVMRAIVDIADGDEADEEFLTDLVTDHNLQEMMRMDLAGEPLAEIAAEAHSKEVVERVFSDYKGLPLKDEHSAVAIDAGESSTGHKRLDQK
ncbi:hypothetical protein acdb102_31010 [Acidothermaceae bacterium B102]|nr:hypothetical protein acdb102_31010 [Acidothermaceae bacterium B102]